MDCHSEAFRLKNLDLCEADLHVSRRGICAYGAPLPLPCGDKCLLCWNLAGILCKAFVLSIVASSNLKCAASSGGRQTSNVIARTLRIWSCDFSRSLGHAILIYVRSIPHLQWLRPKRVGQPNISSTANCHVEASEISLWDSKALRFFTRLCEFRMTK